MIVYTGPVIIAVIRVAVDHAVAIRLCAYQPLIAVGIACCASVGIRLAEQLGTVRRICRRGDDLPNRGVAVRGQGGSGAVAAGIIADVHGNSVIFDFGHQMVGVIGILVGSAALGVGLRQVGGSGGVFERRGGVARGIDRGNIAVGVIGIGIARFLTE